jgi:hypothetical protein
MISIEPPSAVVGAAVGCGRGVGEGRGVNEGFDARRVDRGADAAGVAAASATSVALTTLGPRAGTVEGSGVGFEGSTDSTGGTVGVAAVRAGAGADVGTGADAGAALRCAAVTDGPMMRSANTYPPAKPATTPMTTATIVIGRALTG